MLIGGEIMRHHDAMRRYARRLKRARPAEAEDLVQDTIARAIEKQHLFDGQNLRSWLLRLMHNLSVNVVRRTEARHPHVEFASQVDRSDLIAPPTQEDRALLKEIYALLARSSIERPSQRRNAAFLELYAQGWLYHEIAAHFGIPVGTVRSGISRARAVIVADAA